MDTVVVTRRGTMKCDQFDWSEENVAKLKELWASELSTAAIGRVMRVSKNAIVGKSIRLRLPRRPSPINLRHERAPKAIPPAHVQSPVTIAAAEIDRPLVPKPPSVRKAPIPFSVYAACQWPIGEPGTAGFRFCGEKTKPGYSYCPECCTKAFVQVPTYRPDRVYDALIKAGRA